MESAASGGRRAVATSASATGNPSSSRTRGLRVSVRSNNNSSRAARHSRPKASAPGVVAAGAAEAAAVVAENGRRLQRRRISRRAPHSRSRKGSNSPAHSSGVHRSSHVRRASLTSPRRTPVLRVRVPRAMVFHVKAVTRIARSAGDVSEDAVAVAAAERAADRRRLRLTADQRVGSGTTGAVGPAGATLFAGR